MARKISHSVYFDSDQWRAMQNLAARAARLDPGRPATVAALVRRGIDLVIDETTKRLDALENALDAEGISHG